MQKLAVHVEKSLFFFEGIWFSGPSKPWIFTTLNPPVESWGDRLSSANEQSEAFGALQRRAEPAEPERPGGPSPP